jgi:cytochrome b6-f complex iron-sulfur subunit
MPAEVAQEGSSGQHIYSRRTVLGVAGWGGILACFGGLTAAFTRLMYPRVLFEPPSAFKAGYPTDFQVGQVNQKFQQSERVVIVRDAEGFYAILLICTHLGCTPLWLDGENKFKCPCHGSGYYRDGTNFEGPAPRPMEHVKIALGDDGQIVVDKAVRFRKELGDWGKPGSYLKFSA